MPVFGINSTVVKCLLIIRLEFLVPTLCVGMHSYD